MEIYQNRFIALLLVVLLFLPLFILLVFLMLNIKFIVSLDKQVPALFFCFILLFFTGLAIIRSVHSIIKPRLMLRITETGFEHPGVGFISWNQVTNIYIMNPQIGYNMKFINYNVNNYSEFTQNWSFIKKALNFNPDKSFSITLGLTGKSIEEVFYYMQDCLEKAINNSNN